MNRDCSKVRYATRALAQKALSHGKDSGFLQKSHEVFYCLDCGNFHIGRPQPKGIEKKRKHRRLAQR